MDSLYLGHCGLMAGKREMVNCELVLRYLPDKNAYHFQLHSIGPNKSHGQFLGQQGVDVYMEGTMSPMAKPEVNELRKYNIFPRKDSKYFE